MSCAPSSFYEGVITAGAITTGFCGTFLSFRIQREANYYRQPAVSLDYGEGDDRYIGLQRFSAAFLLLALGTLCSMFFGFLLPLFALAGSLCAWATPHVVLAGLVATMLFILGYFVAELLHYRILSRWFFCDPEGRGCETAVAIVGFIIPVVFGILAYYGSTGAP